LTEVGKLCIETWRYLSIWAALASDPAELRTKNRREPWKPRPHTGALLLLQRRQELAGHDPSPDRRQEDERVEGKPEKHNRPSRKKKRHN
jgi:hypothetical protein